MITKSEIREEIISISNDLKEGFITTMEAVNLLQDLFDKIYK
jgi:hypothetical protein